MPEGRRHFIHKTTYFVTNRLSQGLPFVPNEYLNQLLYGVLARASQEFPDITSCGWSFLQNHYHGLIVTTGDPHHVAGFMNLVDGEIAKYVCRLLGKRHCKVWAQRYHAAAVYSLGDVITQAAYLYANPVAANFVATASEWYGVSTFRNDFKEFSQQYKYVRPRHLRMLPKSRFSKASLRSLLRRYESLPGPKYTLTIKPLAWLSCFRSCPISEDEAKSRILNEISLVEAAEARSRKANKRALPSRDQIRFQNPHKSYVPESHGRRVYCICSDPLLRAEYIAMYREFCARCEEAWGEWKKGNIGFPYPAEAFVPCRPPSASLIPLPT